MASPAKSTAFQSSLPSMDGARTRFFPVVLTELLRKELKRKRGPLMELLGPNLTQHERLALLRGELEAGAAIAIYQKGKRPLSSAEDVMELDNSLFKIAESPPVAAPAVRFDFGKGEVYVNGSRRALTASERKKQGWLLLAPLVIDGVVRVFEGLMIFKNWRGLEVKDIAHQARSIAGRTTQWLANRFGSHISILWNGPRSRDPFSWTLSDPHGELMTSDVARYAQLLHKAQRLRKADDPVGARRSLREALATYAGDFRAKMTLWRWCLEDEAPIENPLGAYLDLAERLRLWQSVRRHLETWGTMLEGPVGAAANSFSGDLLERMDTAEDLMAELGPQAMQEAATCKDECLRLRFMAWNLHSTLEPGHEKERDRIFDEILRLPVVREAVEGTVARAMGEHHMRDPDEALRRVHRQLFTILAETPDCTGWRNSQEAKYRLKSLLWSALTAELRQEGVSVEGRRRKPVEDISALSEPADVDDEQEDK